HGTSAVRDDNLYYVHDDNLLLDRHTAQVPFAMTIYATLVMTSCFLLSSLLSLARRVEYTAWQSHRLKSITMILVAVQKRNSIDVYNKKQQISFHHCR
ncbi:MAG: hypothetical protein UIH18_02760, partial [Fibrobacteraceae bacterium]|nr:hypothetical protein [Fibrobacteraceae bacterium]